MRDAAPWSVIGANSPPKRVATVFGLILVVLGLAGLLATRPVIDFVYTNYGLGSGPLARHLIFGEIYSLERYRELAILWAAWPSFLVAVVGVLVASSPLLPKHIWMGAYERRWEVGLWTIAIVGLLFRSRAYLEDRSLWLDEAFLAASFADRSLPEILTEPLSYGQTAPPGFVVLVSLLVSALGPSDLVLRLLPFIFSVLLVVCSVLFARDVLPTKMTMVTFVGCISFSPALIYYSHEFKPYAIDAFVTLAVIWAAASGHRTMKYGVLGWVGFTAAIFSITAVMTLTAVGVWFLISLFRRYRRGEREPSRTLKTIRTFSFWSLGGALHGAYLLQSGPDLQNLGTFWRDKGGFPPSGGLAQFFGWMGSSATELVWLSFGHPIRALPESWPGPLPLILVILLVMVLGAVFSFRCASIPLALIGVGYFFAFASIYPFSSRLNLYLIPAVALMFSCGVHALSKLEIRTLAKVVPRVALGLLSVPLVLDLFFFGKPFNSNDMKWLLQEVDARAKVGDLVTSPDQAILDWYTTDDESFGPKEVEIESLESEVRENPNSTIWLVATDSGFDSLDDFLFETHVVSCDHNLSWSWLRVWIPRAEAPVSPNFCDFDSDKF